MNQQPFRLGTGGDWGFRGVVQTMLLSSDSFLLVSLNKCFELQKCTCF